MKTQVGATFVGGQFKPDEVLPLAEDTRVTLTIELVADDTKYTESSREAQNSIAAWQALKAFLRAHPIHGGGKRFTRDELHERR